MHTDRRRENQEDQTLQRCQRRSAENFAQHDDRAADRRNQHREQKSFFAIFNHRHHGKDGGEEHDHDQRAGKEELQVMLAAGAAGAE